MPIIHLVLIILALVCFFIAAVDVKVLPRLNLIASGLFLWLLASALGIRW